MAGSNTSPSIAIAGVALPCATTAGVVVAVKEFTEAATAELKPGETYTFNGTLGLVRTVHIMNEKASIPKFH